jgi:hypothetical protein
LCGLLIWVVSNGVIEQVVELTATVVVLFSIAPGGLARKQLAVSVSVATDVVPSVPWIV